MAVRPRSGKVEGAAANWPSRNRLPIPIGFDTPAGTPLKPARPASFHTQAGRFATHEYDRNLRSRSLTATR